MKKSPSKVLQMPVPRKEPLTEAEWEQIAGEIFTERKQNIGRVPDRRRAPVPTWRPDPDPANS
jgi:hypothetical protein